MKLLSHALHQVLCDCGPRRGNGTRCNRHHQILLSSHLHPRDAVSQVCQSDDEIIKILDELLRKFDESSSGFSHGSCVRVTAIFVLKFILSKNVCV